MRIKLENLCKTFEKKIAVNNLTVDIPDGKLISFLGPSGCGKSTIINMISGLLSPTSGSIYFDNINVSKLNTKDRNIGMVFQNYALYPHLSIFDNLAFPLRMKKLKKDEIKRKVLETADFLEIENLLKQKPANLSGGEQQRVAIGRAIIKEPSVLLMDEPLSNLDKKLRIQTREEIKKIQQSLGITTIFITHDQEEAAAISDKILVLKEGSMQQYSFPYDLYKSPTNLFVAKFIGGIPINSWSGYITDETLYFSELNISKKYKYKDVDNIIIAIRPEDIKIDNLSPDLIVSINMIENLGKDIILTTYCNGTKIRLYTDNNSSYKVNDKIGIRLFSDNILLFDKFENRIYEEKFLWKILNYTQL